MSDYNLYTLKENDQEQFHLFKSRRELDGSCSARSKSICKKMDHKRASKFTCKSEKEARLKCAEIGKSVCGTCVSHLYADYE